jgi:hypothetical protein
MSEAGLKLGHIRLANTVGAVAMHRLSLLVIDRQGLGVITPQSCPPSLGLCRPRGGDVERSGRLSNKPPDSLCSFDM